MLLVVLCFRVFGVLLFWLFCVSCFRCLTFCSDVHATFDEGTASYPYLWLSRIFLYTFVLLAIAGLLNVAIFLIEGLFQKKKEKKLSDTLKKDAFHEAKVFDRRGGQEAKSEEMTLPQLIMLLESLDGERLYEEEIVGRPISSNNVSWCCCVFRLLFKCSSCPPILLISVLTWRRMMIWKTLRSCPSLMENTRPIFPFRTERQKLHKCWNRCRSDFKLPCNKSSQSSEESCCNDEDKQRVGFEDD